MKGRILVCTPPLTWAHWLRPGGVWAPPSREEVESSTVYSKISQLIISLAPDFQYPPLFCWRLRLFCNSEWDREGRPNIPRTSLHARRFASSDLANKVLHSCSDSETMTCHSKFWCIWHIGKDTTNTVYKVFSSRFLFDCFSHQVAPLASVADLATRLRYKYHMTECTHVPEHPCYLFNLWLSLSLSKLCVLVLLASCETGGVFQVLFHESSGSSPSHYMGK